MSENEDNGCFMLDIFGQRAHLNFKGRGVSKSNCGVCFTYLFIIFFFWSIFHTGRDIVLRQEPETVESEKFIDSPEQVELSPETFNVAFGIQDPSTFEHYIDSSIYTAKASLQIMNRVRNPQTGEFAPTFSKRDLQLEPCRKDHLGPELGTKLEETLNINKLLCIVMDPNEKLIVQGRFENKLYSYVSIEYSACDRTKANHTCADQSVINAKLLGAYYAMYFTDQAIDPSNFDQPGQRFLNSRFTTLGKDYFKEYTTFVRPVKVTSDTGYLFSDENTLELLSFGKLQENSDFRKFPNFFAHRIRVDSISKFYTRRYIKLQDILSEVDGLITLAIIVLLVVIYPFIKMKFYQDLVNEVFDLKIYKPLEKSDTITKFNKMSQKSIPAKQMRANGRASILFRSSRESSFKKPFSKNTLSSLKKYGSKTKVKISSKASSLVVKEEQNPMQQMSDMPPTTTERELIQEESQNDFQMRNNNSEKNPSFGNLGENFKDQSQSDQNLDQKTLVMIKEEQKEQKPINPITNQDKQHNNDMPQTHFPYRTQTTKNSMHITDDDRAETLKTEGDDQTMIAIPVSIDDFNVYNERNNDLANLERQSSSGLNFARDMTKSTQNDEFKDNNNIRSQSPTKKVTILPFPVETESKEKPLVKKGIQQNTGSLSQSQSLQDSSQDDENDRNYVDINENSDSDEIDEELEDLIQNSLEPKKTKLDISLFDYLRSSFTSDVALKKKMEIFKEGEKRIRERMDVFNIIMKLREIDKLKNILLDKNQLALFDNLPRPVLDVKSRRVIEERTSTRFAALTQGNFIQRVKKDQIFKAVKAIMSKEEKTSVDEKLLDVYIDLLQ